MSEEQQERLRACAAKLEEFSVLIEPLFKDGPERFAPHTDWWCIIAGLRHCSIADVRMLKAFADQLHGPRQVYDKDWLRDQMLAQRTRAIAASKVESPCGNGCVMTWQEQQAVEAMKIQLELTQRALQLSVGKWDTPEAMDLATETYMQMARMERVTGVEIP